MVTNGYSHRSPMTLMFAFIDGLLIVLGVFMGEILRFWGENSIIHDKDLVWRIMLIVLVIQFAFYYFDLYEMKKFRRRIRMIILLLEGMAVSSFFLAVVYYAIPSLSIGRGVLTISLSIIFLMAFLWRFIYFKIVKIRIFKERILIIGTGELAKKIIREISENGQDSFEIVGFVAERR